MLLKSKAPKSQREQNKVPRSNRQHWHLKKRKQGSREETGTATQSDIINGGTGAGVVSVSVVMAATGNVIRNVLAIGIDIAAAAVTGNVTGRRTEKGESTALVAEAGALSVVHTAVIGRGIRIGVGAETVEDTITTTEGAVTVLVGAGAGIEERGMIDDEIVRIVFGMYL